LQMKTFGPAMRRVTHSWGLSQNEQRELEELEDFFGIWPSWCGVLGCAVRVLADGGARCFQYS
jgi:hypothetical protein